jgi:hypothetical protein
MSEDTWQETIVERLVTYTLELDGKFVIIEKVPARVSLETGEQLFSPETVDKLQKMIWSGQPPKRFIETPVYEFSS